jgi:colanic acid/amylovoran biosynthesis glycosyltransferase
MSPSEHRIAYVCKMYPRFSETFIVSEVLGREAQGEDIEIVSLRPPADGRFHATLAAVRAPVHYLDAGTPRSKDLWHQLRSVPSSTDVAELLGAEVRDAAQAIELAALVRDRSITHLHAHFGSVATTVARLAARIAGVTYSFTAHAKDIFHEDVDDADLRAKLHDAHHVVTVSDHNVRFLDARFGPAAARVRRVYNGLDLDTFAPASTPNEATSDVVAVGRLVEKKGFDVLVEACAIARDRGRELRCRIVGTGAEGQRLRELIDHHGLAGSVQLVGALPQDGVRDELRGATVMAAPCVVGADGNADGLPTVLLEAMALGTAVVSTPVTGIPEAVHDGVTGRLVPERDPAALADALLALLDDPVGRAELTAAARRHVEHAFCSTRQAAQLRALLPDLPGATSDATSAVA